MNTVAIIQARVSSTRLPGKVLKKLGKMTSIENICERVMRAETVDEVVVATSDEISDDDLYDTLINRGFNCFRGSLDNVLERFYKCAEKYNADTVIRLTGDNPFVASEIIDEAVGTFFEKKYDYLYYKDSFPTGICVEIFTFAALKKAYEEATDPECIEHVTPYIRYNPKLFNAIHFHDETDEDLSGMRFTMDTPEDYKFVKAVYEHFGDNGFSYQDVLKFVKDNPELTSINKGIEQRKVEYKGD